MKRIVQVYLISSLLLLNFSTSFCQNTFYADQYENTIYSTDLNIPSPMSFDINGDTVPDMNFYRTWVSSGNYTYYDYYIEPLNNFEIVNGNFPPNEIIYPNNYLWGEFSTHVAEETYLNGSPIDGNIWPTSHIFARNIIGADTIYSWIQIGSFMYSFFWATASWTPCLNNIDIGIDTTINHGDSIVLNAGEGYADYLWNTGDTTESIIVNAEDFGTGYWTFSVFAGTEFCEYTDTINILILTVKPVYFEDKLIIFSNVGNNGFTIKSLNGEILESLVLYNEVGQVILQKKPDNYIININNLQTGLYILEVSTKTWTARKKLVQQ